MSNFKKFPLYFVNQDGVIHSVFSESSSTFRDDFVIEGGTILILGEYEEGGGREIIEEFQLWDSLLVLSSEIENKDEGKVSVDLYRKDIVHQLGTPDDLDWDYLLHTVSEARVAAKSARVAAKKTGVNMSPN